MTELSLFARMVVTASQKKSVLEKIKNRNPLKKIILAFVFFVPLSVLGKTWEGTVVGISDGDTLTVLNTKHQQVRIRLTEIDAPEKKQAFGNQSKQSLAVICFKKAVTVDDKGIDRYKRTLGRLNCNGIDANAEQVKVGMAWAYRKYLTDSSIAELESAAKTSKIGLWSDEHAIPPWEFRHIGKTK